MAHAPLVSSFSSSYGPQGWLVLIVALLVTLAMGFFSRGVTVPAEAKAPVAAAPSVGPPVVTGTALPAPLLTAAEASKVAQLRELVANEPPCKNMPLDDACLMRYLRARNMDVEKSATMLKATIAWRHSFGADAILDQMQLIQTEGRTGKTFVAPFRDREGRSVLVLRPRMENTRSHTGNIVHLVCGKRSRSCLRVASVLAN